MPSKAKPKLMGTRDGDTGRHPDLLNAQSDLVAPIATDTAPIRRRLSPRTRTKAIIAGLIIIALAAYLGWDIVFKGPITQFLSNRDQLVAYVESLGFFAPVVYVILQAIQIVVAPIPGQVVGSVGGFLFGEWGIIWTLLGSIIGYYIVLRIARRFGRPLLERIFKKAAVAKFDFILESKSAGLILFAIFLLPGFPDDLVCYLAGLTKLSLKRLMAIILLGRLPTIILTNYFGMGIGEDNMLLVIIISLITVLALALTLWQRKRIMSFMQKSSQPKNTGADVKTSQPKD